MNFFDNIFSINDDNYYGIDGLNKETMAIYVYNYFLKFKKNTLLLFNSLYEASIMYQTLLNYTDKVLFFPMDDFITSQALFISPEFKIERLNTLNKLVYDDKYIVVCNLMGFLRYLPAKEVFKKSNIKIKVNDTINRDDFVNSLYNLGYESDTIVNKMGVFAYRGYVIDIFPINCNEPIRIELWGDIVDSIRTYNVDTQLSNNNLEDVEIFPFSEFIFDSNNIDVKRMQKYLKYYAKEVFNIGNYLGDYTCFYFDYSQIISGYNKLLEEINYYKKNNEEKIDTDYMFRLEEVNINKQIFMMSVDNYSLLNLEDIKKFNVSDIDNYNSDIEKLKNDVNNYILKEKTIIFCISNINIYNKLKNQFESIVITDEKNIFINSINLINKKINKGFIYDNLVIISENDIYNNKDSKSKYNSKYKVGLKISNINNIDKGDYIVHNIHGIGIYEGIITITKNGLEKDYIKLVYNKGDVLYLPVEKIDKISKYSSKEGHIPKIDSLGSGNFLKKKRALRKKFQDIAAKLLKIYAERESLKGFAFSADDENQIMFESEFEYEETPDQISATNKIKDAMEKDSPMDMLLCGDVGYGKTEVAFRAIFKAVNDGKQVAYLCPTTILSNQQYNSAILRFANFPVNIALLNRFVSKSEQQKTISLLKEGKIDILFGTHRILSDDVLFKDLGLLVIDEEQRFGVKHKEKIKEYKSNIDVLTLSATPIPRTLQMSMAGIRGLALIETPPNDRFPIQTYVLPLNDSVIKEAIYKELARGGQTFILYNRIDNLLDEVQKVKDLVPEARVSFAHGRMNKEEIENRMQDFMNYESDVLVCTTIIETGIDIPNVNTLIIKDASNYGLSQLYQIRGRIGRSNKIGYAYLMYDNHKQLNDIAIKRLKTIKEFTELGSGFKIAMRDLSIRGVGDILGSEQSGFVNSVGIDLYLKLLNDEINKLKEIDVLDEDVDDNKPLIEIATHITDNYLINDDIKIEIHKKINEIDSYDNLLKVKDELEDRFGKISSDMEIYMYEEWFEKLAKKLGIEKVNQNKNNVEIVLPASLSASIDSQKLFLKSYEICKNFRLAYKNEKIRIIIDLKGLKDHFLVYINALLNDICEK